MTSEKFSSKERSSAAEPGREKGPEVSFVPPDVLKMYEIPGHGPINTHVFDRYLRDKKRFDKAIADAAYEVQTEKTSVETPETLEHIIRSTDSSKRAELIQQTLKTGTPEAQVEAARMISFVSAAARTELIKAVFATGTPKAQVEGAKKIADAVKTERVGLRTMLVQTIQDAITAGIPEAQAEGARMIPYAPEAEQSKLRDLFNQTMHDMFANGRPEAQIEAARTIKYAPATERGGLIKAAFATGNPQVQIEAASMIAYAPATERAELIKTAFATRIQEAQTRAVESIPYVSETERALLVALAKEVAPEALIAPPLYTKTELSADRPFAEAKFAKSGFETTLLGGPLKGKVIVRRLSPHAFMVWRNLFENYRLWQENGFDYVPIEPIVSYSLDQKGRVEVISGVLDLSLAQWADYHDDFYPDLVDDRNRILWVLKKAGIRHGHAHDANFCLRFYRQPNGKPDFSRKPRIYRIDFDAVLF